MVSLQEWSDALAGARSTIELRALRAAARRDGVPTTVIQGRVIILPTKDREEEAAALFEPADNPGDNSGNVDNH